MELTNFTELTYVLSFTGMIATVCLLTQFTKAMLDQLVENRTKYVVYFFSAALCVLAAIKLGGPNLTDTIITWFLNSIIVWFAAMESFDKIAQPLYNKLFKR